MSSATNPAPEPFDLLLTFGEAERIGMALHDRFIAMMGSAPMTRDDQGWGDVVQFVMRESRQAISERAKRPAGEG